MPRNAFPTVNAELFMQNQTEAGELTGGLCVRIATSVFLAFVLIIVVLLTCAITRLKQSGFQPEKILDILCRDLLIPI